MKNKKNPRANLENYRNIFVQLGLVLALVVIYFLFENKTYEKEVTSLSYQTSYVSNDVESVVDIKVEKPIPKTKRRQEVTTIEKIDNDEDIEETLVKNTDIDEDTFIDVNDIEDVKIDEPIDDSEVPFVALESVPVFPGCTGTNEEKKKCFERKIKRFIYEKFNTEIASDIGLSTGTQKIHTIFKIDKNGNVIDILTRASHKSLQKEAVRVLKLLPKMEPGKQNNRKVTVKYAIPIIFKVQ